MTENSINEEIEAERVKVIDNEGKFIGEMTKEEGIVMAEESGVDLIQLSNHDIPTCKLESLGKFSYEKKKKGKNTQKDVTKEVKFRPNTQENDLQTKMNHINKFLGKKYRVKVTIAFKGREITHSELGMDIANRIVNECNVTTVHQGPSIENNSIHMLLE